MPTQRVLSTLTSIARVLIVSELEQVEHVRVVSEDEVSSMRLLPGDSTPNLEFHCGWISSGEHGVEILSPDAFLIRCGGDEPEHIIFHRGPNPAGFILCFLGYGDDLKPCSDEIAL